MGDGMETKETDHEEYSVSMDPKEQWLWRLLNKIETLHLFVPYRVRQNPAPDR